MRCNRWERETWRVWRLKFDWKNLCPIRFADPCGFVVAMARAIQPVTAEEIEAADSDCHPNIDEEYKPENWGRLNGWVVCVDYGLWDATVLHDRREYLRKFDATN
jgi:hypothetical protein